MCVSVSRLLCVRVHVHVHVSVHVHVHVHVHVRVRVRVHACCACACGLLLHAEPASLLPAAAWLGRLSAAPPFAAATLLFPLL